MVNEIARLAQVYALESVYALGSRAREVLALFILRRAGDPLPLERERLALIMEVTPGTIVYRIVADRFAASAEVSYGLLKKTRAENGELKSSASFAQGCQ